MRWTFKVTEPKAKPERFLNLLGWVIFLSWVATGATLSTLVGLRLPGPQKCCVLLRA